MSIKKQYLKTKPVCKVTFRISEQKGNSAGTAHVVGEFNNWDYFSTPMKKLKKEDLKQEVFDLFDSYVHSKIDRREFMNQLSVHAVGG